MIKDPMPNDLRVGLCDLLNRHPDAADLIAQLVGQGLNADRVIAAARLSRNAFGIWCLAEHADLSGGR